MSLTEHNTYYDVLDLASDASPQEIREGYLKTKSAYHKDSPALYTLISQDERESMIQKIEEAYEILSSPEKRKEYDRYHGLLTSEQEMVAQARPPTHQKIVSIDRVPPMEARPNHPAPDSILVAPTTDFKDNDFLPARPALTRTEPPPQAKDALVDEIAQEIEWRGAFFQKVRKARRISLEEISAISKITKSYLIAIEEENYSRLPAPVYLRGFVTQFAKILKIPAEKATAGYMGRYYQAMKEKKS
ncbi:helix-turn-helix domain-containing protein [Bdellovibrionota bacterium FG-2]